jgi:hypothetical protein
LLVGGAVSSLPAFIRRSATPIYLHVGFVLMTAVVFKRSPLLAALCVAFACAQAQAADINVGPARTYKTLAAGVSAAKAGDRILLDAGTYTDNTAITAVPLTIEGLGAGAILRATVLLPNRKGILVTGAATTVRNITFDGAQVSKDNGNNGAGIRAEAGNLNVDTCTFTNNQDGILVDAISGAVVTVTNSIFNGNGANDGYSHGMYVNQVAELVVTGSTFDGTKGGHDIKSRALVSTVTDSKLDDGVTGTTSYALDFPNGGVVTVDKVTVNQGTKSLNGAMIAYGAENDLKAANSLTVTNSVFTNQLRTPSAAAVYNFTSISAKLANDDFQKVPIALRGPGEILSSTFGVTQRAPAIFSSSQQGGQSYFRFYNSGPASGTVTLSLYDPASGALLSEWKSPSIPPGASPQYGVPAIEAAAARSFAIPQTYSLAIHADINGSFQHVLYRPLDGTFSNLSACESLQFSATAPRATNVHSSLLAGGFPSSVVVYNTGPVAMSATLGVNDARDGARLGVYETGEIAPLGQMTVNVVTLEAALNLRPTAGMYHYNIKVENGFTGMLQHLVNNKAAGLLTDMTATCALNN